MILSLLLSPLSVEADVFAEHLAPGAGVAASGDSATDGGVVVVEGDGAIGFGTARYC